MTWLDVEGWLSEAEGNALRTHAIGKVVLELGSFKGRSTICMAQVAERLVSVDRHKGDSNVGPQDTELEFRANLILFGVADRVEVIVQAIEEVQLYPASFDMAFVDCEHLVEPTMAALRVALAAVKPGGLIFWHDADSPHVREAVKRVDLAPIAAVETLEWCARP